MTIKKIAETTALPISLVITIIAVAVWAGSLQEKVQAATSHVNESQAILTEINTRLTRIETNIDIIKEQKYARKRP